MQKSNLVFHFVVGVDDGLLAFLLLALLAVGRALVAGGVGGAPGARRPAGGGAAPGRLLVDGLPDLLGGLFQLGEDLLHARRIVLVPGGLQAVDDRADPGAVLLADRLALLLEELLGAVDRVVRI